MDDDESYSFVEGYDCNDMRNEQRPDSVVYQPIFVELKSKMQEAVGLLRDPLKQSSYQNIITEGLLRDIDQRTQDNAPEELMFAVVGDMASGNASPLLGPMYRTDTKQEKAPSSTLS